MIANCTIIDVPQRSKEWYAARLGRVTGSTASAMLSKNKDKSWAAGRKNLRTQIVLERLVGAPQGSTFESRDMKEGIKREPLARHAYEVKTGTLIRTCGFVSDNNFLIGCSPDGYVGQFEGLISIKCPNAQTHFETLDALRVRREKLAALPADRIIDTNSPEGRLHLDCIDSGYLNQIRHELLITDALWCDYVSYHPAFPPALQLVVIRVMRDDLDIPAYGAALKLFLDEVEAQYQQVKAMAT